MCYIQPTSTNLNSMEFLFIINNDAGKTIITFNGNQLIMAEEIYTTLDVKRNYKLIDVSSGGIIDISDFLSWERCSKFFIMS